jgi:CRISPR-associated protein (TIGR02710 family)
VAGVRQLESLAWVRARLGSDERWPDHDERRGWELVEDLLANAERCAHRGRYDDAVARLYRATELLAQIRLRRVYDIQTGDVWLDSPAIAECPAALELLEKARAQAVPLSEGSRGADTRDRQVKIGLWQAYSLLGALGDPLGEHFLADSRHLKGFLEMRHRSILAHGLDPVTRGQWEDLGVRWIAWLTGARRPLLGRIR